MNKLNPEKKCSGVEIFLKPLLRKRASMVRASETRSRKSSLHGEEIGFFFFQLSQFRFASFPFLQSAVFIGLGSGADVIRTLAEDRNAWYLAVERLCSLV